MVITLHNAVVNIRNNDAKDVNEQDKPLKRRYRCYRCVQVISCYAFITMPPVMVILIGKNYILCILIIILT